ncbi:opioid growth factor receptor-like [Epinephelus fuscoguttatus]|uniref:opioid growth factor receptor-like n=1 Tax=Epinephelus fuscoguttatus TaxID=293821 RepID=UPI0020D15FD1|nr:opioid growth factor receptor-like [Epinephelus fuscoguttatus]
MRTVSLLVGLVSRLIFIMAWFGTNKLYPVVEWLWRGLCFLWRCIRGVFRPLSGLRFLSLGWPKDRGSQEEPEAQDGEKPVERGYQQEVQGAPGEGQHEAAAAKRAAHTDRELACKRARFEEEGGKSDEDDDESDNEDYQVETSDEFYCGYDSTWETEEQQEPQRQQEGAFRRSGRRAASRHYKFSRFESAAKDMQNYRHDYPSQMIPQRWIKPVSEDKPNLNFYLGLQCSVPDGAYIHDFHNNWYGDYDTLEYVHSYIQWLFPLQEPGVNYEASTLTKEEIKEFRQSSTAKENLLKSYKLMLDFYGIELCDEKTGEVRRAPNWRERFHNLNCHTHNSLRITRILKCQGTLGYPHYQAPLVRFFLQETLVHRELPNVKDSVLNYFMFAVLDKRQRRKLIKFAYLNYDRKEEFVWCPKKVQMRWSEKLAPQEEMHAEFGLNSEDRARN